MILLLNLLTFCLFFLLLSAINIFPFFRQTKKNLVWLVLIFILVCVAMILDFGIEFLPLAYLLIYVGAVAVMFLFVIVTVDAKDENKVLVFESCLVPAMFLNNVIVSVLYFFFAGAGKYSFMDVNSLLNFKSYLKNDMFFIQNEFSSPSFFCFSCNENEYATYFFNEFALKTNCFCDNLSLYHLVEYRAKDVYIFSEYFFIHHSFLLIVVGFLLTVSMIVSLLVAKEFANK